MSLGIMTFIGLMKTLMSQEVVGKKLIIPGVCVWGSIWYGGLIVSHFSEDCYWPEHAKRFFLDRFVIKGREIGHQGHAI